jgi:DNA helicase-2/ATP-dependent DNA helicase PcrA
MFTPRPKQAEVLAYTGGKMGVSAVPGSGKTQTLSALAAKLVAEGALDDDQEVLIVTLVNSAVDNFARRVDGFVQERGLLPHVGYRVRTLHGLAYDIVRERPDLVGLVNDFSIVDERDAARILQEAAEAWIAASPEAAEQWLNPDLDERKRDWVRRDHWPKLVATLGGNFIRMAKDLELTPALLRERMATVSRGEVTTPLLDMGLAIYADYQRALSYRGAVDYDDLIRLALEALQLDGEYLKRLQARWPYILEDEAQDSSRLQEKILRLLTGDPSTGSGRGWVRVGDPNQAIFETFTTASPKYLREFLNEAGVAARDLPNSGRSTQSIMDLANYLVTWSRTQHPVPALHDALAPTQIISTPAGDPQPNPPDDPAAVRLITSKFSVEDELEAVVNSLRRWLPDHPEDTVAVLVPRNERGEAVANALKAAGIEYVEMLKSTRETRVTAGALANVVNYLADPASPVKLSTIYEVWRRGDRGDPDARLRLEAGARALRRCRHVEEFLWPRAFELTDWRAPSLDSLECLDLPDDDLLHEQMRQFRDLVRRWQAAATLPTDQLLLTIGHDLFEQPVDIAVTHKLAALIRGVSESHPDWRLPELNAELITIAKNERKFIGFADGDTGFDPDAHRGKVVIITNHKAKGLEWDRVYLMTVNAYDFPSALPGDNFVGEPWYIRDGLNLAAEALAQLEAVQESGVRGQASGDGGQESSIRGQGPDAGPAQVEEVSGDRRQIVDRDLRTTKESGTGDPVATGESGGLPPLGDATARARIDYAAERLRLLYVGITRAKRDLIVTWNTGRSPTGALQPAAPLLALHAWWEARGVERGA